MPLIHSFGCSQANELSSASVTKPSVKVNKRLLDATIIEVCCGGGREVGGEFTCLDMMFKHAHRVGLRRLNMLLSKYEKGIAYRRSYMMLLVRLAGCNFFAYRALNGGLFFSPTVVVNRFKRM